MCTDLNGLASLKRVSFYLQLVTGNISLNTVKCHYKNKDQFWLWLNVCVACTVTKKLCQEFFFLFIF